MERWNVGILIFEGVEVLDFAGPFEIFSRTRMVPGNESRRDDASAPFQVFTVARKPEPVTATGGLMDLAFRVVERRCGRAVAEESALYIEYPIGPAVTVTVTGGPA